MIAAFVAWLVALVGLIVLVLMAFEETDSSVILAFAVVVMGSLGIVLMHQDVSQTQWREGVCDGRWEAMAPDTIEYVRVYPQCTFPRQIENE